MASLSGRHLHLSYRQGAQRQEARRDATLELIGGHLTFLSGPPDSGKTSLLYVLGCILRPDAGEVLVNGCATGPLPEPARIRLGREEIGFVFQSLRLFPELTVLQNVAVSLDVRMSVRDGPSPSEMAAAALRQVRLEGMSSVKPGSLSAGERRRVGIARALVRAPEILLADEPAGPLDDRAGEEIAERLAGLAHDNRIVTVASRDARWKAYAGQYVRIEAGCIIEQERHPARRMRIATIESAMSNLTGWHQYGEIV